MMDLGITKFSNDLETFKPLVSLIITTYNRASMLKNALDGAIIQTYKNLEIIVADNASSDDTVNVVKSYLAKDNRVRYIRRNINIGSLANHLHTYHNESKGDWVIFISDDDYLTASNFVEDAISKILEYSNDEEVAFYQSAVITKNEAANIDFIFKPSITADLAVFEKGEYFANYFSINFFSFTTTIFNRKLVDLHQLTEKYFHTDVELMLVLSLYGRVILSERVSGVYRLHVNQNYARSNFKQYMFLFRTYINSIEFAATKTTMSMLDTQKWVNDAEKYFYLNIVGWMSSLLQQKRGNPFVIIKRGLFYKILLKLNLFQSKSNYLWIYYRPLKEGEYAVFHIYFPAMWYEIYWYFYSILKIKTLFIKLKK